MADITIDQLPPASTIDASADILPIYTASATATQGINRNTLLGLSSDPVGLSDSQTLTNKTLTSPTISSPVMSGTITGTYTIGGTVAFPSTVVNTTGSQTLSNKVLTSPVINSPVITNATISADSVVGYSSGSSGTIYGISVTSGAITSSSALGSNVVTNSAIASGALYTSKVYNPYKFSVYRNASLTPSGTGAIVFDTVSFDTGSNYSTSTGKFTAPITGYYFLCANLMFAFNAASVANGVSLGKNGTTSIANVTRVVTYAGSYNDGVNVSGIFKLAANDTVEVDNIANPGKALVTGAATTFFHGFLVSAT